MSTKQPTKHLSHEVYNKALSPYAIKRNPPVLDPCNTCIVTVTCTDLCVDKALFNFFNGMDDKNKEIRVKVDKRRNDK